MKKLMSKVNDMMGKGDKSLTSKIDITGGTHYDNADKDGGKSVISYISLLLLF